MYKFFMNLGKVKFITILEILINEKNIKSLMNIFSQNSDNDYFDESVIEGLNNKN